MYKYHSVEFRDGECRPNEFFSADIIPELDKYMEYLKVNHYVDFVQFETLGDYRLHDDLFDEGVYAILKGYDTDYNPS